MKKSLLILIAFLIAVIPAIAQTPVADYSIKGIVKDSITQQPAGFITISLKNPAKQAVKSALTKDNGSFILEKLPAGKYSLTVFSIGYAPKILPVSLAGGTKQTDLGTILTSPQSSQLAAVTITADKPLIKQEVDRLSYDLQADPESKANNVLEMMRKVPMLSLDGEDNILLKGEANFKILINGKPSSMMERSPKDILRSMPASTIERIEVITTPPAKYDAEGVGGIINIVTARRIDNGYNASINTSHRFPVGGPGAGGSLNLKQGKFGISANGGMNQYNAPQTINRVNRITTGTDASNLSQSAYRESDSRNGYLGGELSYEIDSLNLISGQFNVNGGSSSGISNQNSVLNDNSGVIERYDITNNNKGNGHGADAALNYQLGFKSNKARFLTFSYRYFGYGNDQLNLLDVSDPFNYSQSDYKQTNTGTSSEQTFQVDYVQPVKKMSIEAGIKGILRINKSNFQRDTLNTSGFYEIDPEGTNTFNNTQNVFSVYNAYQYNFKNWVVKAGVRLEETVIDVDFISTSTELEKSYYNLIPSVSASRRFKNMSSINFGFVQRIQRPGINMLNPFVDRSNPSFHSSGNPNIRPVVNNDINFGYSKSKKASFNMVWTYTFANNLIMPFVVFDPVTKITLNSVGNVGKARRLMTNVNVNYPITKQWNFSFNGRLAYGKLTGLVNGSIIKNEGFMSGMSASTGYRFNKGWRLNSNFQFNGPGLSIQGKSNTFTSISFSASKDIVKDKLSFSAASNNPFSKYRTNHLDSFGPNFNQTNDFQNYFRTYNVSLNYRFGKLKEAIKKNKRGINNDDGASGSAGGGNSGN